jgi:hypothetical protein
MYRTCSVSHVTYVSHVTHIKFVQWDDLFIWETSSHQVLFICIEHVHVTDVICKMTCSCEGCCMWDDMTCRTSHQVLFKIVGLFCKRASSKRQYSALSGLCCKSITCRRKETWYCKTFAKVLQESLLQKSPTKETISGLCCKSLTCRRKETWFCKKFAKVLQESLLQKSPVKETIFCTRDVWF